MRPVSFDYHQAENLENAVELLAALGEDARPLAGGYSLVPLMNLRLARPQHLIDINSLDLNRIEHQGEFLHFGGLVHHFQYLNHPIVKNSIPLFSEVTQHIAHPTIRNRGTLGGSLAHADPTAELPLMAVLHDGIVLTISQHDQRRIPAVEFFKGAFQTALNPDELIVGLEIPVASAGTAGAFFEFAERQGDFAIAAVGISIRTENGRIAEARIACAGASSIPVRNSDVEEFLVGRSLETPNGKEAGQILASAQQPPDDIRATSNYRKHLLVELTRRAVEKSCEDARRIG